MRRTEGTGMDGICEDNRGVENALHAFLLAPTSQIPSIPAPSVLLVGSRGNKSGVFCKLGKALYAEDKNLNPPFFFTNVALILSYVI